MYTDVMLKLEDTVDEMSFVYPVGALAWRRLESLRNVTYVDDLKDASWLIASTTCPKTPRRASEFAKCPGTANFAFVGSPVAGLPETLYITSVEKYGEVTLTIGKRVNHVG